jgi:deoxyribose-phosphate aldolase
MSDQIPTDVIREGSQPREFPALTREQIIPTLDIAVLRPDASIQDVTGAAREVEEIGAASVCVASYNVAVAKQITRRVCSVIGFPHGNVSPEIKTLEAKRAIEDGAIELDMVINYGRFLEGRPGVVEQELKSVLQVANNQHVPVKAILESCYYQPRQILLACQLCVDHGVSYVKTSTGFGPGGATPWAVELMVEAVGQNAKVKASGGIKTHQDACLYLGLGCARLGVGFSGYEGLLP